MTNGDVKVCRDGWTGHYPVKPEDGSEPLLEAIRREGVEPDVQFEGLLYVFGHFLTRWPCANGKYGFAAGSPQYAYRQVCSGSLEDAVDYLFARGKFARTKHD